MKSDDVGLPTCYSGSGDGLPLGAPLHAFLCQACNNNKIRGKKGM